MDNEKIVAFKLDELAHEINVAEMMFMHWKQITEEKNTFKMAYETLEKKKKLTIEEQEQKAWLYMAYNLTGAKLEYIWGVAFELNKYDANAFQEMVYKYQRENGM